MESITLRSCPSTSRPDDTLTRMIALNDLPKGLIIAQRIEVVLIESTLATMVEAVIGSSLAKVAFDGRDALFHQALNLLLIPTDSLWIREVKDGIFHRHTTCGIHHMQPLFNDLWEETVLRRKIRQLPQTGVEPILRQLLQHAYRIFETVLRKLIIALPIDAEPTCIKVNHIRRNLMGPQLMSNLKTLLLREIGNTAHPSAKTPEGQHRTLTCDIGIFIKDILGFSKEHEEIHHFISHKQTLGTNIRGSKVAGHRR